MWDYTEFIDTSTDEKKETNLTNVMKKIGCIHNVDLVGEYGQQIFWS